MIHPFYFESLNMLDLIFSHTFLSFSSPLCPPFNLFFSPIFYSLVTNLTGTMATIPPPILSPESWSDIDASTFRIRGRTYNQDKVKAASAPSIFKLIAIDVRTVRTQDTRTTVGVLQPAVQFLHSSSLYTIIFLFPHPPTRSTSSSSTAFL